MNGTAPSSPAQQHPFLARVGWFGWNKLFLVTILAWLVLIAWAMSWAMNAGTEPTAPAERTAPTAPAR